MSGNITTSLTSLAEQINEAHAKAEGALRDGLRYAIEAGGLLMQAKSACGHGHFADWLAENFHGSNRTAQVYMRVHRMRPTLEAKAQHAADLTLRGAVSLLAEPRIIGSSSEEPTEEGLQDLRVHFDQIEAEADTNPHLPPLLHKREGVYTNDKGESSLISIASADEQGFAWHITKIFAPDPAFPESMVAEGTKKRTSKTGVMFYLRDWGVTPDTEIEWDDTALETPWTHNEWLFNSHEEYMQRVILGNHVAPEED